MSLPSMATMAHRLRFPSRFTGQGGSLLLRIITRIRRHVAEESDLIIVSQGLGEQSGLSQIL